MNDCQLPFMVKYLVAGSHDLRSGSFLHALKEAEKAGEEHMEQFVWETAEELDQKLAQRIRNIRRRRSISQEKLAEMSGVSYGSIKRFETSGQISLISLTKIAIALDLADELRNLFTQAPYKDIQEVINERR